MRSPVRLPMMLMMPVLAAAAATGCAREYAWVKEGATRVEIERARAECKEESRSYGFLGGLEQSTRVMTREGERVSEINVLAARREADLFEDCMRAKGFTHAPVEPDEE